MRTLWIDYDETGSRYKSWRRVANEVYAHQFKDSPVEGPGSCLHMIQHWDRHGGNPRLWLQLWCQSRGVQRSERVYHEMEVLLEIFHVAGTFDQLNLP